MITLLAAAPGHAFPRRYRLTRTDDFSSVFGFRRAIRGTIWMLHFRPHSEPGQDTRLGLVVGKKLVRTAVSRNLFKRVARERFRQQRDAFPGYDLVLRVVAKGAGIGRHQIAAEIDQLFAKLRPRRDRPQGSDI